MSNFQLINRRQFLKSTGVVGGSFILGSCLNDTGTATNSSAIMTKTKNGNNELGYFVSIARNGEVEIVCHRMEMGQGILTSVPQIIAEELEADWSRVRVRLATADAKFGNQSTGGSNSIRSFFDYTRQMGALARDMLEQAAANKWGVEKNKVKAQNHEVLNIVTGDKLGFGDLAADAANLPIPDASEVKLKSTSDFNIIGKDIKLVGQENIVRGKALYAQDVRVSGMLIASIERPPVVAGTVKSFDASEALKVPGVVEVIKLKERGLPVNVKPVGGVAVLATNTWAAIQGRKKLKVEWNNGGNEIHNSDAYKKELVDKVNKKGIVARANGKPYDHDYNKDLTVEATYTVPYHHHMSMETPSATAYKEGDRWIIWSGTQAPQWGKGMVFEELGLDAKKDADKVEFNLTLMGGAFGRKGKNDFTLEAVELAKATGKPVKVIWSREDDVKHGFYHATSANYCKAELNDNGSADFWVQRVLHPQIGWIFNHKTDQPDSGNLAQGFADIPFALNNLSCETNKINTHVRIGWYRSVHNIHNAFALSSFVDELAVKANISTQQMWMNLLGEDRFVDPAEEGFEGWNNYGQSNDVHRLSTRRMKNTINLVCEKAKVNDALGENEGWGISYATSFNSYAAAASKVKVVDRKVEVLEMHTAIDCGIAVTPDRVKSQMEGAMIMGLSMALQSEITVKDGVIEQNNFHDYPVSRITQVPPLFVYIVESMDAPGGVGEPGLPPVMPSLVNAIYHASGIRIRDLPVNKTLQIA